MTTTSNTDIQQLKEFIKDGFNQLDRKVDSKFNELDKKIDNKFNELDKKVDSKFNELDKKIDNKFNELDKKIDTVKSELQQEITEVRGEIKTIDARFKNVETAIQKIPDISEKFGELKNWRQIAFIIIAAVVGWFARSGRGV